MREIFHTIEQYHMIEPGMRVIAGVSGGADSVCLLHVLTQYRKKVPFDICIVHVEHGIRGKESLADAGFVEALCKRAGILCRTVRIRVPELARERGLSTEEAGRAERYRIFEEVREEQGAQRIAVAHNRDDQAETVLWNLARGSGLKGLGGMRPVRGNIIRPLLFTGREYIEELLREAGIPWRTDQTNLEQAYTRNKIRLSLLPWMQEELNARAPEHIARASEQLQQVQDFVEQITQQACGECIIEDADTRIYLPAFNRQEPLIRRELLRRALELSGGLKDVGSVHVEALMELAGMDCGRELSLPGRIRAVREGQVIRFERRSGTDRGRSASGNAGGKCIPGEKDGKRQVGETEDTCGEVRRRGAEAAGNEAAGDTREAVPLPVPGECFLPEKGGLAKDSPDIPGGYIQTEGSSGIPGGYIQTEGTSGIPGWRIRTDLMDNRPELMQEILKEKKYTKWISYDTIKNDILLRHRQPGDYLVVNARGGRKKLKDYFIDLKIPRDRRDKLWLLADGSHVLWVPGYRISEAVRIRPETEKVIKIQMEEKSNERKNQDSFAGAGGESEDRGGGASNQ